jgi:hypothetical protein
MKKSIFFISVLVLVWFFAFSFNAWTSPAEFEPAPKIQGIVIYPNSAMIKKEAVFTVKKGENIIRISGLAVNLTDESV